MTEKNNQEKESRLKSDECCSKLVMLTDVTNGGGLSASKETILKWQPLTVTRLHITAQKQDICTIISSSGLRASWGRVSQPDSTTSGTRGRAACFFILGLQKTTQGTLGAKHCLIIVLQSMAGRRRSIKQSYAIIYQRLFSQEDHTFDPKKEDWSCNKNEF